jgi:Tol biopolymer transport system component
MMRFIKGSLKKIIFSLAFFCLTTFVAYCQTTQPARTPEDIIIAGAAPVVFLQEGVITPTHESAPCFTPDGNTVYFAINDTIYISKMVNGKWAKPGVALFSRKFGNWDPSLSPDGKRLVFVSDRPLDGMPQDSSQKNDHLWYMDHLSGDNWSKPRHFDAPVNVDGFNNYGPSISNSGTVYFCSKGRDGNKEMCGYYAKRIGNHYDKPKLLALNGSNDIYDPCIAPDERYIIFVSGNDLYISYRNGDEWGQGQKLGPQVNNGNANHDPYVSPDGKMLYYSQNHAQGILMIQINVPESNH